VSQKSDNTLLPVSFTRALRLKVRREAYGWLNAAAVEVNEVFNYCNETSLKAAIRTDNKRKWLSGFDLCYLTAGASRYFDKIGAGTIQSICVHYAQKRAAVHRLKLRWRVSRGARRSLGWVPFKAASRKRKGVCLRFAGNSFRYSRRDDWKGSNGRRAALRRMRSGTGGCACRSTYRRKRALHPRRPSVLIWD
jgi:hypothetical protein